MQEISDTTRTLQHLKRKKLSEGDPKTTLPNNVDSLSSYNF